MTQNELILDHLRKHGSITQAEAVERFGCYRLGARIWDLKKRGINISRSIQCGQNRYGERVVYARYTLKEAQN